MPGDTNGAFDIFVLDRLQETIERVNISHVVTQADGLSDYPSLSADGRFVAFQSSATNLIPGDTNDQLDIFVHDRQKNTIERVSVSTQGDQANAASLHPVVSTEGRFVTFLSSATNLVPGAPTGVTTSLSTIVNLVP